MSITASTLAEARKLHHLGITTMPRRSTLSDANARRPEAFFEAVYRDLLASNRHLLSADSRSGSMPSWFGSLRILDSTTIPLFSNLIFKGVGRNPKNGQKKGGMAYRIQEVEFTKKKGMKKDDVSAEGGKKTGTNGGKKEPEVITHRARIVTYPDVKRCKGKGGKEIVKGKMVSLLTNDFTMEAEDIIAIYKKRWEIDLQNIFQQRIKTNYTD